MNNNKNKFNIDNIKDKLPVNYSYMSQETYRSKTKSLRSSSFEIFKSGSVTCQGFYKPISKIFSEND